ncbi:hypothetical protein [Streptomyces sp. NPDC048338]|uniref:hypothetical protein n=1 Tax=Streptomyces sp. NPDC048338 TaxID=3365536 RepID=UPI003722229D
MTVTGAARLTGAALAGALALVTAGWILRDLVLADGSAADLLWYWAGDHRLAVRERFATFGLDPVLFLVYAVTTVAALRSPGAASALAAAGVVTLGLRLPGLWATSGATALVTTLLVLGLAAALLATAALGRRPVRSVYEPVPARPRRGPAVTAGVLLLTGGLLQVLWEVRLLRAFPSEVIVDRYIGGRSVVAATLAPPPGWLLLVLVLLLLTAAAAAVVRPPYSRPFGMVAGALLGGWGLTGLATAFRHDLFVRLPDMAPVEQLVLASALFDLLAGATVVVVLAGPGERRVAAAPQGLPALPPAPPSPRPPGW